MTTSWGRVVRAALCVAAIGCASRARVSDTAEALGVSGIDPENGFPLWYEDAIATRVVACLDAADPNCIVLADEFFDPAQPVRFPDNFPGEFFYTIADSDRVTTPGCPASGIAPGRAFVRTAVEGTFATGSPLAGDPIVFGRIRIVASGLCPLTRYTITHPHGVELVTTNEAGAIPANAATEDIGCLGPPCAFAAAEASRVFTDFIRWDPAVAPAAPTGYLGDAVTPHPIVGTPNTAFRIADPAGATIAETSLFTVSGKLAGPLLATPSAVEVGGQVIGTTGAPVAITITNVAPGPVTITGAAIAGDHAADFAIASDACTGVALARDATCALTVSFAPSALDRRRGELSIVHDGGPRPLAVPLTGTGIAAGATPALTLAPAVVDFGSQRVGTTAARRAIAIGNGGTAPLGISSLALTGAGAAEFAIVDDRCTGRFVDPGATCTIAVAYAPLVANPTTAAIAVITNDPASPHAVALTGVGFGGYARVAATLDPNGFPAWYQDEQGLQVRPCLLQVAAGAALDADPRCVLLADEFFDPTQPLVFPTNFPGEFFFHIADSDGLTTPGCPAAGVAPGRLTVRVAVEGTFGTGAPTANDQIVFARTRFTATGLCPLATYRVIYPYGAALITTDDRGKAAGHLHTTDVGCAGPPCAFGEATRGEGFAGFLHWDATPPAPPPGFLGDPGVPHPVTGATYVPFGESAPANFVRLEDLAGNLLGETANFAVAGYQGELVGSPAPVDFGAQAVLAASAPRVATITNVDADPAGIAISAVVLGGAHPGDFAIASETCTAASPLLPGQSCTVTTTFTPTTAGGRSASVAVVHGGPATSPLEVILLGTGGTAALVVEPPALAFGDQVAGTTSLPEPLRVVNRGTAPAAIAGVALTGADPSSFAIVGDGCSGHLIAAGGSCGLDVVFRPGAAGARTAAIEIASDAPGSPHVAALGGTGVPPSEALVIDPPALDFGDQTVALPSAPRTLAVTNAAILPTSISAVAVVGNAGDVSIVADSCTGATLAPGGGCTLAVVFRPTAVGPRAARIDVADLNGQRSVAVTGTGVVPSATPAPGALAFGTQAATTTSPPRSVVLANGGPGVLRVSAVAIGGADPASFAVTGDTCTGQSIAPGASCTIAVVFRPPAFGPRAAELRILDNTAGGDHRVPLTGSGSAPQVSFSVNPLGFGLIRVGQSSTRSFNVINTGDQNLIVGALTIGGANAGEFTVTRNRCTTALAPGRDCTINVTFVPAALGPRTATLSVASNAPPGPSVLTLEGSGK